MPNDQTAQELACRLVFNLDRLPALPELPLHLKDLPFLVGTHFHAQESVVPIICRDEPCIQATAHSHRRLECLGGWVLGLFISNWIQRDPEIEVHVIRAAQSVLLGNDVLTQLAEAYSCSERVGAHLLPHPKQAGRTTIESKIQASCFGAYFGLVWHCVLDGGIPGIALLQYFENLLSDEVCPNLRALIKECQQGRSLRRNGEKRTPQEEDDGTKMDWTPAEKEQTQYEKGKGKEERSDEKKGKEKGKQKQKQGATADQRSAPQKAEQSQQVVQNARPSADTDASAPVPVPEPGPPAAQQEDNDTSEMDWSPTMGQNNGIGFSICCQCI